MKKQIITLMLGAAFFATTPLFAMDKDDEVKIVSNGITRQIPQNLFSDFKKTYQISLADLQFMKQTPWQHPSLPCSGQCNFSIDNGKEPRHYTLTYHSPDDLLSYNRYTSHYEKTGELRVAKKRFKVDTDLNALNDNNIVLTFEPIYDISTSPCQRDGQRAGCDWGSIFHCATTLLIRGNSPSLIPGAYNPFNPAHVRAIQNISLYDDEYLIPCHYTVSSDYEYARSCRNGEIINGKIIK